MRFILIVDANIHERRITAAITIAAFLAVLIRRIA